MQEVVKVLFYFPLIALQANILIASQYFVHCDILEHSLQNTWIYKHNGEHRPEMSFSFC